MRKEFFNIILSSAKDNPNIFLLSADMGFNLFEPFQSALPDRFINCGVAEANMVGVAAGLSLSGKNVYCYAITPFITGRCFEQIKLDVCAQNLPVKLVGSGGGLCYGAQGITHNPTEDIAIMRALPNMTVVCPGDIFEATALAEASVEWKTPMYIRLANEPLVYVERPDFEVGKGITVVDGSDFTIVATGNMLYTAKKAVEKLREWSFHPRLISMHTVKPLDHAILGKAVFDTGMIFTVEEHSVIGGLGSAVAEYLSESGRKAKFKRIGLPDKFIYEVGSQQYLRGLYGLTPEKIAETIFKVI